MAKKKGGVRRESKEAESKLQELTLPELNNKMDEIEKQLLSKDCALSNSEKKNKIIEWEGYASAYVACLEKPSREAGEKGKRGTRHQATFFQASITLKEILERLRATLGKGSVARKAFPKQEPSEQDENAFIEVQLGIMREFREQRLHAQFDKASSFVEASSSSSASSLSTSMLFSSSSIVRSSLSSSIPIASSSGDADKKDDEKVEAKDEAPAVPPLPLSLPQPTQYEDGRSSLVDGPQRLQAEVSALPLPPPPPPSEPKQLGDTQPLLADVPQSFRKQSSPSCCSSFCTDILKCFFGDFSTWKGTKAFFGRNKENIAALALFTVPWIIDYLCANPEDLFSRKHRHIDLSTVDSTLRPYLCYNESIKWNPSCDDLDREAHPNYIPDVMSFDDQIVWAMSASAIYFGKSAILPKAQKLLSFVQSGVGAALGLLGISLSGWKCDDAASRLKSLTMKEQDGGKKMAVAPEKPLFFMTTGLFFYALLNFFMDKVTPLPYAQLHEGGQYQLTLRSINPAIDDSYPYCDVLFPNVTQWKKYWWQIFGCAGAKLFYNRIFMATSYAENAAGEKYPTYAVGAAAAVYGMFVLARMRQKFLEYRENQASKAADAAEEPSAVPPSTVKDYGTLTGDTNAHVQEKPKSGSYCWGFWKRIFCSCGEAEHPPTDYYVSDDPSLTL